MGIYPADKTDPGMWKCANIGRFGQLSITRRLKLLKVHSMIHKGCHPAVCRLLLKDAPRAEQGQVGVRFQRLIKNTNALRIHVGIVFKTIRPLIHQAFRGNAIEHFRRGGYGNPHQRTRDAHPGRSIPDLLREHGFCRRAASKFRDGYGAHHGEIFAYKLQPMAPAFHLAKDTPREDLTLRKPRSAHPN